MKEVNAVHSSNFSNAFGIFSLGQAAGLIVPSRVGNYSKVPMVMKLDDLSFESGLSAVNAETILDLVYICVAGIVSLIILSTFFLPLNFFSLIVLIFLIACLIGVLAFLFYIKYLQGIYGKSLEFTKDSSQGIFFKIPAYCVVKIYQLSQSTRTIFTDNKTVVKLIFFSLCFHLLAVLGFVLVIGSAHANLPLLIAFAIVTVSFLVGIVSLIPGGWGASDLSLIVLLVGGGISLPVATNIIILWRIVMYLPIFLVIGTYIIQKNIASRTPEG